MRPVYVAGAAMTRFAKHTETSFRALAHESVRGSLDDAGLDAAKVDFVAFGNAAAGILTGQEMIRAQVALAGSGLDGVPMINVENACASASSAFHLAWMAVASGQADAALAVGTEKMTHPEDKKRAHVALARAVDIEALVEERGESVLTEGPGALFMDIYAAEANAYSARSGATARDYAATAAKNHRHGSLNPKSQFQRAVDVDEVLASRLIQDPLTLLMCSPIGDGSASLLLCSEGVAKRLGRSDVQVRACVVQSGIPDNADDDLVVRSAARAYEQAGLGPDDLDLVELHDAASPAELIISEELGLAPAGEGVGLLRDGATTLGGRVPINVSGGLVSKGHPVGATGCAQLVELTDQLRGRCGARQVAGARVGLAENAGGWLGGGPAACVVTVLARA